MNQKIQQSLKRGINYLKTQQNNGGFSGYSSANLCGLDDLIANKNIFFSALVLECLANVLGAQGIKNKLCSYLLQNRSSNWSWNYWERGSATAQRVYPDDLDDTACSIIGLKDFDPDLITPSAQAHLAQCLINCEVQPGGPYATWLVQPDATSAWKDIDVVVNANIGYMLHKLGVHSGNLDQYISECILKNNLKSPYYVGIVPSLYCIARWYCGDQLTRLQDMIRNELKHPLKPLHCAMLISAACNAGIGDEVGEQHIQYLIEAQAGGSWPAEALYFEPPENGRPRYAGSPELTTAFVLEALTKHKSSETLDLAAQPEIPLRTEIDSIANVIAEAGHWSVNPSVLSLLNSGSRNGWKAYTIYDDFLDGEGDPKYLSAANSAMRQSIRSFKSAVPGGTFAQFVDDTFDTVDSANDWEVSNARDVCNPPDYLDYHQLAHRSWGHVIAPTGVLLAHGYKLDGLEVASLHTFFSHYIIAKQLCDDAHDWKQDFRKGHISAAVAMLLWDFKGGDANEQAVHFWQKIMPQINRLIRHHIQEAQLALDACSYFVDSGVLRSWLDRLAGACANAEQGRESALQFIETFVACSAPDRVV